MEVWREELYHHGIKGQKWGVRRYQNKDGSLTEAGKKRQRYTHGKDDLYNEDTKKLVSLVGGAAQMIGSGGAMSTNTAAGIGRTFITKGGKGREKRLENALGESKRRLDSGELNEKEMQKETKRSEKLNRKLQAQRKANEARDIYDSYTSNGKMLAQDLLLGSFNAEMYRNARARGAGRVRSWLETGLDPIGAVVRGASNKKRYGDWFVASDGSSDELYAKERLHSSNDI